MNDSRPPKPKRGWYQFPLCTLLVSVLLISLPLVWFWRDTHQQRRQLSVVGQELKQARQEQDWETRQEMAIASFTVRPQVEYDGNDVVALSSPRPDLELKRVNLVAAVPVKERPMMQNRNVDGIPSSAWDMSLSQMPCAVHGCFAASDGERVYVVGGTSPAGHTDQVRTYHIADDRWEDPVALPWR